MSTEENIRTETVLLEAAKFEDALKQSRDWKPMAVRTHLRLESMLHVA